MSDCSYPGSLKLGVLGAATAISAVLVTLITIQPVRADDSVDEIHRSYGDERDEVTVSWRGTETTIFYGLSTAYGSVAAATDSEITPVDRPGPFREVRLTGLAPDTTYHYRIGPDGADHELRTAPLGSFRWAASAGWTSATPPAHCANPG